MSRCDGLCCSSKLVSTIADGEVDCDVDELDARALREELRRLKAENASLKKELEQYRNNKVNKSCYTQIKEESTCVTVKVPQPFDPIFKKAEHLVGDFFQNLEMDPRQGTIRVGEDRYILLRGSAMTVEFSKLMLSLLGDKNEALSFVKNILFDLAHSVGKSDAKNFISKMQVTDPIEKLSSGPINFAYTGWASVAISPESTPVAGSPEGFYLLYDHLYSFEADTYAHWQKQSEEASSHPVCSMNCGYSSGWCEESFNLRLVASEVLCRGRGDPICRFIMAHPNFINSRILAYQEQHPELNIYVESTIPGFFERRNKEKEGAKQVQDALDTLRSQHAMLQHERQKVLDLLHCILPERVAQKMANGEKIVAERREATILFCDIVGFTKLSAKLPPESVVLWLDSIFTKIDMICEKHGIEKIKTIGDAYMCCSGLVREQADHIERMARFALSLRDAVRSHHFRTPDTNEPVNMRIGMHTGLCVSGIIGRSRFMFDTYGDSVNTASRMESHGIPGEVQVTEEVFKALKNKFFFLPRMDGIEFKGKGFLKTYFLMGEKSGFEEDAEATQTMVSESRSPYYHEKDAQPLRQPCKPSCSCPPDCCCKSEVMLRSDSFDTCVGVHIDSSSSSSASSSPLAPSSPSPSTSSLLVASTMASPVDLLIVDSESSTKPSPVAIHAVEPSSETMLSTISAATKSLSLPCVINNSSSTKSLVDSSCPETKQSISTITSPVSVRI